MRKYLYKNIVTYEACGSGSWCADYKDDEKRFALHVICCRSQKLAYHFAKHQVDVLNIEESNKLMMSQLATA